MGRSSFQVPLGLMLPVLRAIQQVVLKLPLLGIVLLLSESSIQTPLCRPRFRGVAQYGQAAMVGFFRWDFHADWPAIRAEDVEGWPEKDGRHMPSCRELAERYRIDHGNIRKRASKRELGRRARPSCGRDRVTAAEKAFCGRSSRGFQFRQPVPAHGQDAASHQSRADGAANHRRRATSSSLPRGAWQW